MAKKDNQAGAEIEEKPRETTVEFLASLAAVLVTGLFIITFVVQAFEIPSSSMENTLLIGDHVFVNRIQFAPKTSWAGPLLPYRQVRRGDIVVFLHPDPHDAGTYVVKRIMGVPGDRIHLRDGVVYRNGEALKEPYVLSDPNTVDDSQESYPDIIRRAQAYRKNFPAIPPSDEYGVYPNWLVDLQSHIQGGELVVPPGHYFAMGDHRDVSLDSRYWGFIPQENIIGRPMFIYWSFETPSDQYTKTGMADRIGFLAHVVLHFFDETRWRRTLGVVR
ncbi:MAG: signal peptidase I [Candidatus Sulfotelmatobacter sp.]